MVVPPEGGCAACGVLQTPQWRATPRGVMCNACGMRHRNAELRRERMRMLDIRKNAGSKCADSIPSDPDGESIAERALARRACVTCGTRRTPQWRTLPVGHVCNACGTKHKYTPFRVQMKREKRRAGADPVVPLVETTNTVQPRHEPADVLFVPPPPHVAWDACAPLFSPS